MAGLRELRKRLLSIRTTGKLAGAMRTVAAAKYARLSAALGAYRPYAEAFDGMLALAGGCVSDKPAEAAPGARPCLVLMSANRGLCGGFNAELTGFFDRWLAAQAEEEPMLVACGKIAEACCKERKLSAERVFPLSDVPSWTEANEIAAYVRGLYESGRASRVSFIYQRFKNMLVQTPAAQQLLPPLPPEGAEQSTETLLLPEPEPVRRELWAAGLDAAVYALTLENAAGAQAATLMAMRSTYDNAQKSAAELETTINRRRQAEVTAGVIETASDHP